MRTLRDTGNHRRAASRAACNFGFVMLLAILSGCSITGTSARTTEERELTRNRQRWASAGVHDYEFDFQRTCFCLPESTNQVRITVRQDAIASVVRVSDGQPAGTSNIVWPRVDELFAEVQKTLEQGAERLEVTYDPTYGYPRSIVVDRELMAVDGGYALTSGNLRRLP